MSVPKRATNDPVQRSDEETQDEIEQIMSEIEQLQKEIGQAPAGAIAVPNGQQRPKPQLVKTEPALDGPTIESGVTESDPLEEFRAGASGNSDASMEDTIGELKGEEGSRSGVLYDEEDEVREEQEEDDLPEASQETREAIARASREVEEAFEEKPEEKSMSVRDHHDDAGGDGALTMSLRGNMTLRLQYEIEGQTVTIGFADQALKVQLADGTEFKIPMKSRAPLRRSA